MKVLLAGAFGHVGSAILKELVDAGHNVVAADIGKRKLDFDGFLARTIDFTNPSEVKGCCEGVDLVITNLALIQVSDIITPEEVDYQSNKNLLDEAVKSGVKHFVYVSEYKMETAPNISLFSARLKFEEALKESGLTYTIFRPVGFFFDIAHRFD
ncbi:MAG: NAD(P)H-binding protein, partial [Bacillota bacterium]|nr:NAD(P)H-binding protein [Bacillota bacterium]